MSELSRQEALFEQLESGDLDHVRSMLESFHPSEIADLLDSDEMLIDIIVDKVKESSNGELAPEKDDVVKFLKALKSAKKPKTHLHLEEK